MGCLSLKFKSLGKAFYVAPVHQTRSMLQLLENSSQEFLFHPILIKKAVELDRSFEML
jgi:hypothetical protein